MKKSMNNEQHKTDAGLKEGGMTNNGDNTSVRDNIVISQKTSANTGKLIQGEMSEHTRTPCRASNIWINDTNIVTL